MNVPDLRNVDFDAYRRRAEDLRAEAIGASIDRAVETVRAFLAPRGGAAGAAVRSNSSHCPA